MGIRNLMSLLRSKASKAITTCNISEFSEKTIARDASISIYQFLIATNYGKNTKVLQDSEGNPTAHLIGILNSTILYKSFNITPIWVFDGKSPSLKTKTLAKRSESRELNQALLDSAKLTMDTDLINKFSARSFTLTAKVIEDAKKLLSLLGQKYDEAPGEAEAECTHLLKQGIVNAVFSEDMDSLAFGASLLVRGNTELTVIKLENILDALKLNFFEFLDLCILLGCDYSDTIKGMGQVNALQFIKKHNTIEDICSIIQNNNTLQQKYSIPEEFFYKEAREYFLEPAVSGKNIISTERNIEGLKEFLINEKAFSIKRVETFIKKFEK